MGNASATNQIARSDRREYRVAGLSEPVSHYTDVVTAGGFAFISGMVAMDAKGNVIGGDNPTEQARQVLRNLRSCLDEVGAKPSDVCKVTVYLRHMSQRSQVNVARQEFFGNSRPASTLVEVSAFVLPDLLVEIEAVAILPRAAVETSSV